MKAAFSEHLGAAHHRWRPRNLRSEKRVESSWDWEKRSRRIRIGQPRALSDIAAFCREAAECRRRRCARGEEAGWCSSLVRWSEQFVSRIVRTQVLAELVVLCEGLLVERLLGLTLLLYLSELVLKKERPAQVHGAVGRTRPRPRALARNAALQALHRLWRGQRWLLPEGRGLLRAGFFFENHLGLKVYVINVLLIIRGTSPAFYRRVGLRLGFGSCAAGVIGGRDARRGEEPAA